MTRTFRIAISKLLYKENRQNKFTLSSWYIWLMIVCASEYTLILTPMFISSLMWLWIYLWGLLDSADFALNSLPAEKRLVFQDFLLCFLFGQILDCGLQKKGERQEGCYISGKTRVVPVLLKVVHLENVSLHECVPFIFPEFQWNTLYHGNWPSDLTGKFNAASSSPPAYLLACSCNITKLSATSNHVGQICVHDGMSDDLIWLVKLFLSLTLLL